MYQTKPTSKFQNIFAKKYRSINIFQYPPTATTIFGTRTEPQNYYRTDIHEEAVTSFRPSL